MGDRLNKIRRCRARVVFYLAKGAAMILLKVYKTCEIINTVITIMRYARRRLTPCVVSFDLNRRPEHART